MAKNNRRRSQLDTRGRPTTQSHARATIEQLEAREMLSVSAKIAYPYNTLQNGALQLYAGETLHLNALNDTYTGGSTPPSSTASQFQDPLDTQFQWNFGDLAAKYNSLPGFNAAHVYDRSGVYTATLTVTEGGVTSTNSVSVNVSADTRPRVYVAAHGTGNGTSPSSAAPLSAILNSMASSTVYLFHNGDTFTIPYNGSGNGINLSNLHDVTISDYSDNGGATLPIFDGSQLGQHAAQYFLGLAHITNITVENINFDSGASTPNMVTAVAPYGTNTTVRNCIFGWVQRAVDASTNTTNGILVQDNSTATDPTELLHEFMVWGGTDTVIVGNTVYGSDYPENLIRGEANQNNNNDAGPNRMLLFQNSVYYYWPGVKQVVDVGIQAGAYAELSQNHFGHASGGTTAPSVGVVLSGAFAANYLFYGIVERNYFDDVGFKTTGNAQHLEVRNNAFKQSTQAAVQVYGYGVEVNGTVTDFRILNNTAINVNTQSQGQSYTDVPMNFLNFQGGETYSATAGAPRPSGYVGISMENNLYFAPYLINNGAASVALNGTNDLLSFDTIQNNIWQNRQPTGSGEKDAVQVYYANTWTNQTVQGWNQRTTGAGTAVKDVLGSDGVSAPLSYGDLSPLDAITYSTAPTTFTPLTAGALSSVISAGKTGNTSVPDVTNDFYGNARSTATAIGAVQVPGAPPSDLTMLASGASITLNWAVDPAANFAGGNVQGYKVYRSPDGTNWTALNGGALISGTTYNDAPGTGTWYYKVTTVDDGGYESATAATGMTTTPSATVWSASDAPSPAAQQNVNDPNITTYGGAECGENFKSDVTGFVNGVRFWKGNLNTGTHSGQLWSTSGQLLATATFTNESSSGWQQVNFPTPVLISAGTTYIIAYHTAAPYIAYNPNAFSTTGKDNGNLHILSATTVQNGVSSYDAIPGTPGFPNTYNGQAPNYWLDVVFTPGTSSTIWSPSDTPSPAAQQNVNDPNITTYGGAEMGLNFKSDVAGYVSGVRFWKGTQNTGTHTGQLWDESGDLLASATFTGETSSGWQQVTFATPVLISSGTVYTIGYHTTAAYIAYNPNTFSSSGKDSGSLHALQNRASVNGVVYNNGVSDYDAVPGTPQFPHSYNGQAPNYWVDVLFIPLV